MNLSNFYHHILSQISVLYIATILTLSVSATNNNQQQHEADSNPNAKIPSPKYNVPFLVLMSSNEISVAQLPLIENGTVSVAYRLFTSSSGHQGEYGEEDESLSTQHKVAVIADAREYEQQMPKQQTTILGTKSEWQQIAGNKKSTISAGQSKHDSTKEEEVGIAAAAKKEEEGRREEGINRPRRSNNLTDDGSNNSSSSSDKQANNSLKDNVNAVLESSSSSFLDVTSAQFRRSNSNSNTNNQDQLEERTAQSPAEDDKNHGGVQFSDFDVHMSFGYAFVADSTGRIHRFRLSGFGNDDDNNHNNNNYYVDEQANLNHENSPENAAAADYTNTIDAPVSRSDFSPSSVDSNEKFARTNNITSNNVSTDGGGDDDAAAAANKVSQSSDVTHEQSGRHPTVSGKGHFMAQQSGKSASGSATARSVVGDVFENESGAPTSAVDSLSLSSSSTVNQQRERRLNSAKPRIIWSRIKHNVAHPLSSLADSSRQYSHTLPIKGALPSAELEVGGNDDDDDDQANQAANETEHMESGGEEQQLANESPVTASGNQQQQAGHGTKLGSHLRTEIAVDWLNNLLFVLDKYRLVVIDFDGDNELVLIDDFNKNNRPIDIKVDPVNDFLFWLQVGNFHNTIYKLDLSLLPVPTTTTTAQQTTDRLTAANTLKLGQSGSRVFASGQSGATYSSELVALISHHYAHPIITNLPKSAKLFKIDHKHSRIYVPLAPSTTTTGDSSSYERNKTQREDTEVFAPANDESNVITHLNVSTPINQQSGDGSTFYEEDGKACNTTDANMMGQILTYNLDGTDMGPLRNADGKSHLASLDDMQDITMDSDKGYLYWLTNNGKELFEEYKNDRNSPFFSSAQHNLDGKMYAKLMHFGSNQPRHLKPRFNLRKLIQMLSASTSTNRSIRSNSRIEELSIYRHRSDSDSSRFSRNAPYIILGITCLVVLSVYLIYALIFQQSDRRASGGRSRDGSIGGSSLDESNIDCEVTTNGFIGTSTISRWIAKPSTATRSTDTSTFNRDSGGNDRIESCDIESTNYNTSNAVDEHYRDIMNNQTLLDLETNLLANLSEWPTNMNDMSNKLYVPVEVLQDEALSSIHRITIDQLEIEHRARLGEGHFGTVLQGTITCTVNEKTSLLNKSQTVSNSVTINVSTDPPSFDSSLGGLQNRRIPIPSSVSSGHGSSSTSSEFITATSCADATNGDYLTPKSHCNSSTMSDYAVENPTSSRPDSCSSYYNNSVSPPNQDDLKEKLTNATVETKFKVAIKKLKDNASAEEKRDFLQEAKLLANFDHPNIIHLIGICLDRGSTLIVMELMLGGDLIRYMQENRPRSNNPENLTNDDLLTICLDIVNGCCYLEELNYIHRDLAARNCLVSSQKKEERVVKLADFGLARDVYKDSYYKKLNDSAMPLKWMAPECLIEQKFTTMSDVWSFGVVMWEVMSYCQKKPYGNVEPFFMKEHLTGGARLEKPENCSDDIYRLMNECWQLDPKNRPTFQECRAILIEIKNSRRM